MRGSGCMPHKTSRWYDAAPSWKCFDLLIDMLLLEHGFNIKGNGDCSRVSLVRESVLQ